MKTLIFASIFALIVSVSAQFTEFPICADPCSTAAVKNSECTLLDYKCLCESPAFGVTFSKCVLASCSEADAQATHNYAAKACALVGITIPSHVLTSAVLETGAATTPAATTPATGATTGAVTATVAGPATGPTTGPATVTVTAPAAGTTTGSRAGTGASAGDAVKMVGSGFAAAAAIAAALFIL